ncbi:MAG: hypothetical protein Q4G58_05900 [bacterium]|nr:hypothetical protein [bacterium]
MHVVIEENKQVERFFKLHEMFADTIRTKIYEDTELMIREKGYKIKTVRGAKYRNRTIFEYKIVVNAYFKCRVAYITEGDTVTVFYLSTNIIKANFTKEVMGLSDVHSI